MPIIKEAQDKLAKRIESRFWKMVKKGELSQCWLWQGGKNPAGYGRFYIYGNVMHFAHRLSYELAFGDIQPGMVVMHKCDNPSCVNPNHLEIATQEENMLDKHFKGRQRYPGFSNVGSSNPAAVIDESQAAKIREEYPSLSYAKLAGKYGISKSQVFRIVKGQSWKP